MKFIIEPINETDCRIVDIDCSDKKGKPVKQLTIPATVKQDGKTFAVKEVGGGAYKTNKEDENQAKYTALHGLKKITFSEGIETIGNIMGNNGIDTAEYGNADTLKEVVFPSTLKVIGECAFRNCKALSSVNIPDGVEEIGKEAFMGCSSLTLFQWPKSLKKVDLSAFSGLRTPCYGNGYPSFVLTIPDSIESIEGSWNIRLEKCIFPAKLWDIIDGSYLTYSVYEIDVPEGVTKIRGHYHNLRKVSLPSTLEEIGDRVFAKCSTVLDTLKSLPPALRVIGEEAFYDEQLWTSEEKELYIPSSVVSVGRNAFNVRNSEKIIRLIGEEATMKMLMGQPGALNGTLIKTIDIPHGTTEVEIIDCPELVSLTIPSTVTKITSISKCPLLQRLVIPDSVTQIDEISYNESLRELHLPANLKVRKEITGCPNIGQVMPMTQPEQPMPMTQPITIKVEVPVQYLFVVNEADVPMLSNTLDLAILAVRYLRDKTEECRFCFKEFDPDGWRAIFHNYDTDIKFTTPVNSNTEISLETELHPDFSNPSNLPKDFPTSLAPELAQYGTFSSAFQRRCPNFMKKLPDEAPAYLSVCVMIEVVFDFMIGDKEEFDYRKITVMKDWNLSGDEYGDCWRFCIMYDGRYIPATSFSIIDMDEIISYKDMQSRERISASDAEVDGVIFLHRDTELQSIPFIDDILKFVK